MLNREQVERNGEMVVMSSGFVCEYYGLVGV